MGISVMKPQGCGARVGIGKAQSLTAFFFLIVGWHLVDHDQRIYGNLDYDLNILTMQVLQLVCPNHW